LEAGSDPLDSVVPLVTAEGPLLEHVLDGTFPLWGEGLSRQAYGRWNRAQSDTAWGRTHFRRVALVDAGAWLASAKRYDLEARVDGASVRVLGIGAVFTPPARRGQGHARALIEALIADAAASGCASALLFSEIDPAYYERLGFCVVPQQVLTLDVARMAGSPAVLVRSGEPRDLDAMAEMSSRASAGSGFALERSPEFLAFGIARKRLLAGLGAPGARSVEWFVTEEAHRAAAYVVITREPRGVFLEDCGDCDPSGARVGAMLQALAARTPADPPPQFRAWWPAGWCPPQVRIVGAAPAEETMMVRMTPSVPAIYRHLDVF
jgi:predicted N-acetyltransferase YhbS